MSQAVHLGRVVGGAREKKISHRNTGRIFLAEKKLGGAWLGTPVQVQYGEGILTKLCNAVEDNRQRKHDEFGTSHYSSLDEDRIADVGQGTMSFHCGYITPSKLPTMLHLICKCTVNSIPFPIET